MINPSERQGPVICEKCGATFDHNKLPRIEWHWTTRFEPGGISCAGTLIPLDRRATSPLLTAAREALDLLQRSYIGGGRESGALAILRKAIEEAGK